MPTSNPRVVIFSSVNEDLTLRLPELPSRGSTSLSTHSARSLGGKGANTAVAASKAAAASIPVSLVAAVGDDPTAAFLLEKLRSDHHVDVTRIAHIPNSETGRAVILVDQRGENCIVVNAGANLLLTLDDRLTYDDNTIVLGLHLEIALDVVCQAAEFIKERQPQGFVVLNASPIPPDPTVLNRLLHSVDLLIVNEGEACSLGKTNTDGDDILATLEMIPVEPKTTDIIVTLGPNGALLRKRTGELVQVAAIPVNPDNVADTTGAGDCLTGYVCAGVARGEEIEDALRIAVAASAICVQHDGAADAIPELEQAVKLRAAHNL